MFFDYKNVHRDWQAKWIWDDTNVQNEWKIFRKTFDVASRPDKVTACISAESRYWLYINGKCAVFEGSLKRGINLEDGFYDEVDITKFIKSGKNTIAALCWYWGERKGNMSCNSAGKPGFIFEADINGTRIITNESWRVHTDTAYIDDRTKNEPQPNYRLPEFNVYYDERLSLGDWQSEEYDDSAWENASVIGSVPDSPWGNLHKRPIPLLKEYGLCDYVNSKDYENYTTKNDEILDLKLPYNAQITPYIELETDISGLKIDIRSDTYQAPSGGGNSVKCVYITDTGKHKFECLGWFSGEHVYYSVPKGVTIRSLKYRESGYDTEFKGYFKCDDEFFNKLWQKSLRTLYITMRDNFMDCPDRERAQWWGDVTNEMMMLMYCLDDKAYALYEKGLYTKMGYIDSTDDYILRTLVPTYDNPCELPAQELAGITGMWEYYLYTGNDTAIKDVYWYQREYLLAWYGMLDNGFQQRRNGSWDWHDWGKRIDVRPLEIALYYRALVAARKMAMIAGKTDDLKHYDDRMASIKSAYNRFWTEKGYKSAEQQEPDDRVNAMAVLAGLSDESNNDVIASVLNSTFNSSPYMEKYVYDAMCKLGNMEDVQKRMRLRYSEMVNDASTTLWEHWELGQGTKNHAWSGGPLITMSKHMAGVAPTTPGYGTYKVEPDLGILKHIEALVPSVKGDIIVVIDESENKFTLELTSPEATSATVILPYKEGSELTINGIDHSENDSIEGAQISDSANGRIQIEGCPGKWKFEVKNNV